MTRSEIIRFILNRKYFLKLYHVPQSKWRRKIFEEIQSIHGLGLADAFNSAWEYLDGEGLI